MRRHKNCRYCGCLLTKENRSVDHVVARINGGGNGLANLVLSCKACNRKKGGDWLIPASFK